jgi:hypothetical protein
MRFFRVRPKISQGLSIVIVFVFTTALLLLLDLSSILSLAFPVTTFAIGVYLYRQFPILYIGFTWWIWFLTPLIARIVEFQNHITDQSLRLIILSPYLVTIISVITFLKQIPKLYSKEGLPYILAATSIIYAIAIGVINGNSIIGIAKDFASWIVPILFGFHIIVNWKMYGSYRKITIHTFMWSVLIMGVYGIFQYMFAPAWDTFWLINAEGLDSCCGWPEPFQIRVWSTQNYPFTFGYVMSACLLVIFDQYNFRNQTSLAVGLLALLLSTVRSAWLGLFVGMFSLLGFSKVRTQLRISKSIALILIVVTCTIFSVSAFSDEIISRLETFTDLHEDNSLDKRTSLYLHLGKQAIVNVFGSGMGTQIADAGLIDVLETLGWFGSIIYAFAVCLVLARIFSQPKIQNDPFINSSLSITLSIIVALPFKNTLVLMPGVLFWGFCGFAIAGYKFHRFQSSNFSRC